MTRLLGLVWRDPALRMVAAGILLFGASASSLGIHQSLVVVEVFGIGDARYSLLLFAPMIVAVTASMAIGVQTDRTGKRRTAALAVGAWLGRALLVSLARPPWAFVLAHVLLLPVSGSIFG